MPKPAPVSAPVADSVSQEARTRSGVLKRTKNRGQTKDATFAWVNTVCQGEGQGVNPMENWRTLAAEYMGHLNSKTLPGAFDGNLWALRKLLEHYLWKHRLCDPDQFFTLPRKDKLPPLLGAVSDAPFRNNDPGVRLANCTHNFLTWVLREKYSSDEDGHRVPYPHHRVPFDRFEYGHTPTLDESVHSPLPYKYIRQLREMLAEGQNFSDWKWAQSATGNRAGTLAGDWFEVPVSRIDKHDPDCVWRTRDIPIMNYQRGMPDPKKHLNSWGGKKTVFEIWSPVSAVALLTKLEMPFRTYQVRMLDSGETDFHRAELDPEGEGQFLRPASRDAHEPASADRKPLFKWGINSKRDARLAKLARDQRTRVSERQGVFLKSHDHRIGDYVGFFVNTNKTADADKDWQHRGYRVDWQHDSLLRWFVKLRNWQEKYNPVTKPTLWAELNIKHTGVSKSDAELTQAAPTCFLFRDASIQGKRARDEESTDNERKPISNGKVNSLWGKLLEALEHRMNAAGEPIRFIKVRRKDLGISTVFYPLHALRVSLITAFADAGMGLDVLMRLAGHTRLVMTLYYRKLNTFQMNEAMRRAQETLTRRADELTVEWLKGKAYADLPNYIVADEEGLQMALPRNPNDRNPAGWERQLGGWCLMGRNPVPTASDHKACGGCFNGGAVLKAGKSRRDRVYAPVRPKACIEGRCRWFVTRPEYLLEIKAKADLWLANLSMAQQRHEAASDQLDKLRREKLHTEHAQTPFVKRAELDRTNRLYEKTAADVDALLQGIAACTRLLDRVMKLVVLPEADSATTPGIQLVAQGTTDDLEWAFTEVKSELLHWSGICLNAEVYPELQTESATAIVSRAQLLDAELVRRGIHLVFAPLTSDEQLRVGNRFMRELAAPFAGNWEEALRKLQNAGPHDAQVDEALQKALAGADDPPIPMAKLLQGTAS